MKQSNQNVSISYVRKQLTETLLKLLKEYSLKELSITRLCEEAYVGRASFYRNYKNIEDILVEYDHKLIAEWRHQCETNPKSTPETLIPSLIEHYSNHKEFYLIIYKENLSNIVLNTILSTMNLHEQQNNITAYAITFWGYGLFGIINEWISRGMQESAEELKIIMQANKKANSQEI